MASAGSQDFELEDSSFEEETPFDGDDSSKAALSKASLTKRRLIDDILEAKRLQRSLKEYDFDDIDD